MSTEMSNEMSNAQAPSDAAQQAAASNTADAAGADVSSEAFAEKQVPDTSLHIVLASKSPRRKELLEAAGVRFMVHASEVDETLSDELASNPDQAACVLAERKAGVVVQELLAQKPTGVWVIIGADTIVALDGRFFGKPRNISQATNMLRTLSNNTHQVVTGVSVWMVNASDPQGVTVGKRTFADVSSVTFKELSDEEIADYLKMGESFDKAGAYAIQGHGAKLVSKLEGAIDTVIGLPVGRLLEKFPDLRQA